MDQKLSQNQSQKLILSPQVRQYLRFLQLPLQQLEDAIEQEITENPALDEPQAPEEEQVSNSDDFSENSTEEKNKDEISELDFQEKLETLDRLDENLKDSFYPDLSKSYSKSNSDEDSQKRNYQETLLTQEETLNEFLTFQMNLLSLNNEEKDFSEEIIGTLNEDGYLSTPIEEIARTKQIPFDKALTILKKLQTLDPPGICAQNLVECLLLQLRRLNIDTHIEETIVKNHIDFLEKKDFIKLSRKTNTSIDRVKQAYKIISQCEPKPGRLFSPNESIAIVPDSYIFRDSDTGELVIEMNEEPLPRIRVNPDFKKMLRDKNLDKKTKEYVKNKVDSAFWLIKALEQRQSTLKEITHKIAESQSEFFDQGFSSLKPLRLKDIAEKINMHESTVSRGISGKYVRTPQGTIPYKSFFSTKMDSDTGSESQKSILEKIKTLVQKENSKKPLSDEKLVEILNAEGIKIARRTVAKYRGLLKMLPSHLRKER